MGVEGGYLDTGIPLVELYATGEYGPEELGHVPMPASNRCPRAKYGVEME